nr:probable polygalacturonase At3g15720 [Tanacetum cinerariifolium]GFB44216.1 probable polygalacturonase At3g15720 [Tanacetum cinerariifolium]
MEMMLVKEDTRRRKDKEEDLYGNITAPKTPEGWENYISKRFWIEFSMVQSLTINRPGQFDGQGRIWWGNKALSEKCERPT